MKPSRFHTLCRSHCDVGEDLGALQWMTKLCLLEGDAAWVCTGTMRCPCCHKADLPLTSWIAYCWSLPLSRNAIVQARSLTLVSHLDTC